MDTIFMFGQIDVSVILDDDDRVWFKAVDLARALELDAPRQSVDEGVPTKYTITHLRPI